MSGITESAISFQADSLSIPDTPRRGRLGIATVLLLLFVEFLFTPAHAAEHASAEDCRVIVAIGTKAMNWSEANAPSFDHYPDFGDYVEDCAWKDYGVAAPRVGDASSLAGFYITRPVYNGATATAEIHTYRAESRDAGGRMVRPHLRDEECTLERKETGWSVVLCSLMAVN